MIRSIRPWFRKVLAASGVALVAAAMVPATARADFAPGASIVVVDTAGNGNGNGAAEPGESALALTLPVTKTGGSGTSLNVVGTLVSLTSTATILSSSASYPDVGVGATVSNSSPFTIAIDSSHPCQTPVDLRLTISTDQGNEAVDFSILAGVPAGSRGPQVIGINGQIPDNNTAGVSVPLTVPGVVGLITSVSFRFTGTSDSTEPDTVTSTGLGHANVGDLVVKLTSPQGTTVILVNRPGSPGPSTANNFKQVHLSDAHTTPIQDIGSPPGPITGSFTPANPFSAFIGEDPRGTWTLNVADVVPNPGAGVAGGEGGWVRRVILDISYAGGCEPVPGICCGPSSACTVVASMSACSGGTFNPYTAACTPPAVEFAFPSAGVLVNDSAGNGNNNGVADPSESQIGLTIPVINKRTGSGCGYTLGANTVSGVTATLESLTSTATVVAANSTYPDMAYAAVASNATPFVISLGSSHPCGTPVDLRLNLTSPDGSATLDFSLPTGQTYPGCAVFAAGAPVVLADSTGNGNSNGMADPGESALALTIPVNKTGGGGASTGFVGTLSSLTSTVTVVSSSSAYPDLTPGSTASNSAPFVVAIDPSHPCGVPASLRLSIVTDGGLGTGQFEFSLPVGLPLVEATFPHVASNVAIPDGNPAGVSVPLTVSGTTGTIVDLNFRFSGTNISGSLTSSGVGIRHGNVGDLVVKLTSPQGTVVTLCNRPGSPTPSTANNFVALTLDDAAADPIQLIGDSTTVTGLFSPFEPLSAFIGESANGTWVFNVADVVPNPGAGLAGGEGGNVRQTIHILQMGGCTPPLPSGVCCRGATCSVSVTQANCVAAGSAGALFMTGAAACNTGGSAVTPCCYGDYNKSGAVSVQDIFDFLADYFSASPLARVGGDGGGPAPTVQSIFDFLGSYFGGC